MDELSESILVVHPYVIQETTTVLAYQCGIAVAKHFLSDVGNATNVIIPAIDIRYDMRAFMSIKKKISFADATLIELSRATGAKVITFDRQILSSLKSS